MKTPLGKLYAILRGEVFLLLFWGTDAQGVYPDFSKESLLAVLSGLCRMPAIEPKSATYKARTFTTVLSFWLAREQYF